jgi:hypothetical protein
MTTLWLGIIPLFAESEAIHALTHLDNAKMSTICTIATYGGKNKTELPAHLDSKYNEMILSFAQKFDGRSTSFLNKFMCSEMCPCYDEAMIEENVHGIQMSRFTPRSKFYALSEQYMNYHGRTKGPQYTYQFKE